MFSSNLLSLEPLLIQNNGDLPEETPDQPGESPNEDSNLNEGPTDATTDEEDEKPKNPLEPTVPKPGRTGHRPWPDDSIRPDKMENLYVLLVGINAYPTAPLNGCIKDVELIASYLTERYDDNRLHLVTLTDEQATYEGIRKAFREHLRKAGPKDSVWFHFSGHGTEAYAPEEFMEIEPSGKDQNLVCYVGEGEKGRLLLADKELAVLLEEVARQDQLGRAKKSPHIVVSLDCCHSGSGTRFDQAEGEKIKVRNLDLIGFQSRSDVGSTIGIRELSAYADGYYQRQLPGGLKVPAVPHVLLAACDQKEKAGDMRAGGVFTNGLIKALKEGAGELSYSDLFIRTRATVHGMRNEQTPQFETINSFDPYAIFLEGSPGNNPKRYEVIYQSGTHSWHIKCGAIHGLPTDATEDIKVEIQTQAPENRPVALAKVVSVGAQFSGLEWLDGEELNPEVYYQAVIRFLPATVVNVWVHGEEAGIAALRKVWDDSENILMADQQDDAAIDIKAADGQYMIRDLKHRDDVRAFAEPEKVVRAIGLMVQWDRVAKLENPASRIKDWTDFQVGVLDNQMKLTPYQGEEVKVFISKENHFPDPGGSGGILTLFKPSLHITHMKQKLYVYLLHLRESYAIKSYEGVVPFNPADHPGKTDLSLPLWTDDWAWGIFPGQDSSSSYLKVLVTTEPLDHQQLLQKGALKEPIRDFVIRLNLFSVKNDWYSFTLKAEVARLNPDLASSVIQFANFRGNYAFTSAYRIGRSQDPAQKLGLFDQPGFALQRLNNREQRLSLEVLELFPGGQDQVEVSLDTDLVADQSLVAIAFDGKDFHLAGESVQGSSQLKVTLPPFVGPQNVAPGSLVDNPFEPGDKQSASLYQNWKVGFFKKNADFDMGQLAIS